MPTSRLTRYLSIYRQVCLALMLAAAGGVAIAWSRSFPYSLPLAIALFAGAAILAHGAAECLERAHDDVLFYGIDHCDYTEPNSTLACRNRPVVTRRCQDHDWLGYDSRCDCDKQL